MGTISIKNEGLLVGLLQGVKLTGSGGKQRDNKRKNWIIKGGEEVKDVPRSIIV